MEKQTSKKSKSKIVSKDTFKEEYIKYVLLNGKNPTSVYAFASLLNANEADFYVHFNSFKALDSAIWTDWFLELIQTLKSDEAYEGYSVREKYLALLYTWVEILKANRSFVQYQMEKLNHRNMNPMFMIGLRAEFKKWVNDLILEGKDTTEIVERPFASHYEKAFWIQFIFISKFWSEDESDDYQKTDSAIEKSVNLAFDLIASGPLDSMLDFAKFWIQNKAPKFSF